MNEYFGKLCGTKVSIMDDVSLICLIIQLFRIACFLIA